MGDLEAVLYRTPREAPFRQRTMRVGDVFDNPEDMSYHIIERIRGQSVTTKGGATFTKRRVHTWLKEQPYQWSKQPVSALSVAVDCRVRLGDTYHPQFQKRIPPFYDLTARYDARPMTEEEKQKAVLKRRKKIATLRDKKVRTTYNCTIALPSPSLVSSSATSYFLLFAETSVCRSRSRAVAE